MFKRNRYYSDGTRTPPFGLFIIPVAIFLVCLPYLANKSPLLMFIILASLGIAIILASLYPLYGGFKINHYVQKHNFQLWKKSKNPSLKERMDASKEINSLVMQTPCLEKYLKHGNKIAFILLIIWTLIFLGIFSFIIFSRN